jgi:nucleoside-diphosphate-sugar epimerase
MNNSQEKISVILTGATGFVGEGVLLTCLEHEAVQHVLSVSRKPSGVTHAKLEELIVPDFVDLTNLAPRAPDYDACFYCAASARPA